MVSDEMMKSEQVKRFRQTGNEYKEAAAATTAPKHSMKGDQHMNNSTTNYEEPQKLNMCTSNPETLQEAIYAVGSGKIPCWSEKTYSGDYGGMIIEVSVRKARVGDWYDKDGSFIGEKGKQPEGSSGDAL